MSLPAVAIGALAGLLSGMFGVGGGILTTPAIRALGYPALVAVGTPLPVIIPTAMTGAYSYWRKGLVDVRAGCVVGACGALVSVFGAVASRAAGGRVVLGLTAVLVLYVAADMARQAFGRDASPRAAGTKDAPGTGSMVAIGALAGAASGFLGLGGGFILVPAFARMLRFPIKRAIGTSLLAISIIAVPGSAAHRMLGHVDVALALALIVGVIPGAWIGSRLTQAADDRWVRMAFAMLLSATGAWLLITQFLG